MYEQDFVVKLVKSTYRNNDTLYVGLVSISEEGEEPFCALTVNIGEEWDINLASDTSQYIDTNNLGTEIVDWLVKNKIGEKTPFMGRSGYCSYPLMYFTKSALDNAEELK